MQSVAIPAGNDLSTRAFLNTKKQLKSLLELYPSQRATSIQETCPGYKHLTYVSGRILPRVEMNATLKSVLRLLSLILVLSLASFLQGQTAASALQNNALVKRALAAEVKSAQGRQQQMRYRLRKATPHFISTKEIFETKDGAVARLLSINDRPLSQADEQKEETRLNQLLADPNRQRRRKQAQEEDAGRALKVLRVLPDAFLYEYAGTGIGPSGKVERFTFVPNPRFNPPDLETQVLTAMSGELWVDPAQERVTRLEGHLQEDVDFGWGILGRLNKGGWIVLEQAEVGDHQWRIVHFKMNMSGRVVFKNKVFDTSEDESEFAPVASGIGYQQAIQILRTDQEHSANSSR